MFSFLVTIFNVFLYQPLFNFLVLLYNYLPGHDFGAAIIVLTIIIRLILYPISVKAISSQKTLQSLQPKIQEIQRKYKDDKRKQSIEIMEIYKKEKINPFSGLFLALIQLPILIALYLVFWKGLNPEELANLYKFVTNPGQINPLFLGIINLSKPSPILAVLAGIFQFFQTKMLAPKNQQKQNEKPDLSQMMQKQMLYFFPFMTVLILFALPSAIGLYWTCSGIFSVIQQQFILKKSDTNTRMAPE
jgi:YidC/Oxa1 family membrane protein insertase